MLSAIFCAIEEDNHSGLEELLDVANIDVNQTNKHGESGVHIAAGLGRLEMLRVLGGHGADLGALDSQGDSAVYWAARQGHTPVIEYLVTQGVRVDQQNKVSRPCVKRQQFCCVHVFSFYFILFLIFHSWARRVFTRVVSTGTQVLSSTWSPLLTTLTPRIM